MKGRINDGKEGFMKKKLLSIVLATAMVLSVCACGNDATNANGTSETQVVQNTTESNETVASAEPEEYVPTYPIVETPITVKALVVGADTSVSSTRKVWEDLSKITNVNFEWEFIDKDALSTYLASGDWPDLFMCELSQSVVNDYGVSGGKFVNYLDYIHLMPNLQKTFEDYPHTLATITQINGEVYNLFKVQGACATSASSRTHYRVDVLENAGIKEAPATVDEFYESLVTLKKYYGVPSFIHSVNYETDYNVNLFGAFGPLYQLEMADDGTGKVVFSRTTEQMKLYYQFLNKLYEEELMNREYLTLDASTVLSMVREGNIAYFPAAAAVKLTATDLNDDWTNLGTLAPLVSEYDNTMTLLPSADCSSKMMYINAESEYIEEICRALDVAYATEEVVEGSNMYGANFTWGEEGVHWKDNGDGTYTEMTPEGYDGSKSSYMNKEYFWQNFGRADALAGLITDTPSNSWARTQGYVTKTIPYDGETRVNVSSMKLTEDEQYVIDNKYGEIVNYYKQMEAEFISGAADIETKWDEYVSTIEKMGINEVLKVYQTAYDRWNEALNALSGDK